jgi:hypothetical protein
LQYYLWWAPKGTRKVHDLPLAEGEILIRAVRHHDDHRALTGGHPDDYVHLNQRPKIENAEDFGIPWTQPQLDFVAAKDPIRLVAGRPGSGKTTVLWQALESRASQRVLYLTWSRELTRVAREHFQAYAPKDVEIEARDFFTFLGELCGHDIKRQPLRESQARFAQEVQQLQRNQLGVWRDRERELHAEIRGYLLGGFVPPGETPEEASCTDLQGKSYLKSRKKLLGRAANEAVKIFASIETHPLLQQVFPELMAAREALTTLQTRRLPEGLLGFDRIVVDEVQDLTLVETAVITELCRAIAHRRGHAPWLLLAGDEAQTVRPSGFRWARLSQLIASRVGTPTRFQLEENLRCPARIAAVIGRASERYSTLEKGRRPSKQRAQPGGQHVEARVLYVEVAEASRGVELLRELEKLDEVVVVSASNDKPSWVPRELEDLVLTPPETKGLEYQAVCVLDPGELLEQISPTSERHSGLALAEEARRTSIDQLRVALSRATETLAFLDVAAPDTGRRLSLELLGDDTPILDPEDLLEQFSLGNISEEECIQKRIQDALNLIEERPRRAWLRASQAVRLLGDPDTPNGIADQDLREQAQTTLLATAARLLVDGTPEGVHREEVVHTAQNLTEERTLPPEQEAFQELVNWTQSASMSPFSLLEATVDLAPDQGEWIHTALTSRAQEIRKTILEGASKADSAKEYSGSVEEWLRLTGFLGDIEEETRKLRGQAFDTLLKITPTAKEVLTTAENILERLKPRDSLRFGRLRERQERHQEAAQEFERASSRGDAIRNWRQAGEWRRALKLNPSKESERRDLDWLAQVKDLLHRRPEGLLSRLSPKEAKRLRSVLQPGEGG